MEWFGEIRRRFSVLLHRSRFNDDLAEEMQAHLEMQAEDNEANGMPPDEARYAALRQFGNPTRLREMGREVWGWRWLDELAQDLRYAFRTLAKSPGFTTVAVLTLALGIGASTLVFTVVHAVLLAPLPYREPDRLVSLLGKKTGWINRMSAPDFADIRAQSTVFEDAALAGFDQADFAGAGEPERIEGSRGTANLFSVLGINTTIGRHLEPADDRPGAPAVVVLSHALWRQRFGGDPAVIGKTITLGRQSRTIVGVMPPRFQFPDEQTKYWIPLGSHRLRVGRAAHAFSVVARLKPGATLEQARAEVKTISSRLERAYPATNAGWSVDVVTFRENLVGGVRSSLLILFGAVAMVLFVACANVANLLLSRGVQRQQEMAVRAALGAGQRRLIRLLLAESLMLAVFGGALGVMLVAWGVDVLVPLYPPGLPRAAEIQLSEPVLAFTLLLSLATALLAGLLPAFRTSRTDVNTALKAGGWRPKSRTGPARGLLVIAQIALAMVLLTCAGLLVKSFLARTDVKGFDPSNLLAIQLPDLPQARFSTVLERIRTLPGVTTAASTTSFSYEQLMTVEIEVQGRPKDKDPISPMLEIVTPDYFQALKIPLRKGRRFEERDGALAPSVVVINEALARRCFWGKEPIGKAIRMGSEGRWLTIVGVVGDVPMFAVDRQPKPAVYLPYLQAQEFGSPNNIAIRTAVPPKDVASAVRRAIRELEPNTPIIRMATMREDLSSRVASPRFYTLLLGLFAGLALALAALGVYGVVSFTVGRRTHEIGVRMALGATGRDVLKEVMREGAALAIAGVAIGVVMSLAATRVLTSTNLLFRVRPADPFTFLLAPAVLLASALAACWIPARRATKIDPMEALRYE